MPNPAAASDRSFPHPMSDPFHGGGAARRQRPARLVAVLALLVLALPFAGCGTDVEEGGANDDFVDGATAADTGEDTTIPAPEDAVEYYGDEDTLEGSEAALGSSEVEVRLFARTLEMPATLPEGRTTFVITNTGDVAHNFEIEGRGLEEELETPLQPGETAELTVELTAGDYTIYCPVGDHQEEGMERQLRVTR